MKRKWLSMFLICMMLFSIVPCAAFADGMQLVAKSSTDNVTAGDTFTVSIDLEGNPGVAIVDFTVGYDDSVMTLKKASKGDLVGDNEEGEFGYSEKNTDDNPAIFIVMNSDQNVEIDGTIFNLTFEVKEDAVSGEYPIKVSVRNVEKHNGESLTSSCSAQGCAVSVKSADPAPTTYKVDVKNGAADKATAAEGETVTITANAAPEGQEFDKWTGDVTFADANAEETTFTMPANNVTVTANYKDKEVTPDPEPGKTYAVTVVGGTASVEKAAAGTAVKVTPTVPEGKKFDSWTAEGIKITESMKYQNPLTFEMPENNVTVTANFVDIDAETYKITVKNGTIVKVDGVEISSTDTVKAEAGAVITIKANDASTGNTFKEWTGNVTFSDKNAKTTTFTMPAEAVTVTATYTSGGSTGGGGSSSGGSSGGGGGAYIPPTVQKTVIVLTIDSTTTTVDGKEVAVDAAPLIVDGRTYTPARFVAEQLGATVAWDEEKQLVTITGKDNTVIELTINSRIAVVNDKAINMDAAAFIKDGRTYTPSRFVAEQLGATVEWDETTRQVTITKTK